MTYVYENVNVRGQRVTRDKIDPRLEMLANWKRISGPPPEDTDGQDRVRRGLDLASAERDSIEAAARNRASRAGRYHDEAQEIAAASASGPPTGAAPNVTPSHTSRGGTLGEPLLARPQDGTLITPLSREELEEKARLDSLAAQQSGVLDRAYGRASIHGVDLSPGQTADSGSDDGGEGDGGPDITAPTVGASHPVEGDGDAGDGGPDGEDQGEPEAGADTETPEPPAKSAGKPAWVAHGQAVEARRGGERERSDDEVAALTVAQLQQHYG